MSRRGNKPPSSSGPGRGPLKAQTAVRVRLGAPDSLYGIFFHVVFLLVHLIPRYAWREQVADTLGRQDIQAARIMIERFIIKIELGYDEVRIWYRYPLGAGLGRGNEKEMLEAEPIERSLHDMDRESIQSIYELAPHLAEKPLPPRPPKPVNPRDLEIYRMHTEEKKTIRQIAEQYQLSEIRVWNICTAIRKSGIQPLEC